MSDYASLTVAQLKELLKSKSLPVDGKKADLLARLTEADGKKSELDEPQEATETSETVGEASEQKPAEEADSAPETAAAPDSEPAKPAEATEATEAAEPAAEGSEKVETEKKPKKKVLTPEERKQLAVDLLNKKIKRAEKFGDEALAQEARANLARVEKFGVDPGTALAKEIGAVDRGINSELKPTKRRGGNKNGPRKKSKN